MSAIGTTDAANHQYDSHDFFDALAAGNLPNVVFLKAPGYQDGHAGYSSPLDEQIFIADTINQLEESKFWDSTAVIIEYDDSDGWYDHQMGPIIMHSQHNRHAAGKQADALTGTSSCGSSSNGLQAQGRCGYGPRLPFLVISPWAKTNFVDHTVTDQSSTIAFIEQNWGLPFVSPAAGGNPGSYDQYAGPITNMFDFTQKKGAVIKHKVFIGSDYRRGAQEGTQDQRRRRTLADRSQRTNWHRDGRARLYLARPHSSCDLRSHTLDLLRDSS